MIISLIAAVGKNRVIGKNNQMIWHLPPDLEYFKKTTLHHHILMGRKTYESLPKHLPGRTLIVISRNNSGTKQDSFWFHTLQEGIRFAQNRGEEELFVIGGSDIFNQTMKQADRLYLTEIQAEADGDVYFPKLDSTNWQLRKKSEKKRYKDLDYYFTIYYRKKLRKSISHQDE